jgi:hypothetical protein
MPAFESFVGPFIGIPTKIPQKVGWLPAPVFGTNRLYATGREQTNRAVDRSTALFGKETQQKFGTVTRPKGCAKSREEPDNPWR